MFDRLHCKELRFSFRFWLGDVYVPYTLFCQKCVLHVIPNIRWIVQHRMYHLKLIDSAGCNRNYNMIEWEWKWDYSESRNFTAHFIRCYNKVLCQFHKYYIEYSVSKHLIGAQWICSVEIAKSHFHSHSSIYYILSASVINVSVCWFPFVEAKSSHTSLPNESYRIEYNEWMFVAIARLILFPI